MERYGAITGVTFGQTSLPLPMSVRIVRRVEPAPAGSDADAFDTSIQINRPTIGLEVRLRDTSVADGLSLGQADVLTVQIAPTRSAQAARTISITDAVLTGIEFEYDQSGLAVAKLIFQAEAADGQTDPFAAGESQ